MNGLTYYCPVCWQTLPGNVERCPSCGADLAAFARLSYEDKLLQALDHPLPGRRLLAIRILGDLGSHAALSGLGKLLETEVSDIYALRETLIALSKIQGPRSQELLQKATTHPYPLIQRLASEILGGQIMADKTTIVLVRHGQTEWNRVERFRGRADVPLNETGMEQAEATGRRVAAQWTPVAIYSSPLSRAVKTAEAIAKHFGLQVQQQPGLVDIDYGEWQGLTPDEARRRWLEEVDAWYHRPQQARIPGGETLSDLRARAMQTVKELAEQHTGNTIVLVGHTVINRIILLGVLGLGNERFWRIKQDTCAINVFEFEGDDFVMVSLNDACHLHQGLNL